MIGIECNMMYYTPLFVEISLYVTFPQPAQKRGKNEIMNSFVHPVVDLIWSVSMAARREAQSFGCPSARDLLGSSA